MIRKQAQDLKIGDIVQVLYNIGTRRMHDYQPVTGLFYQGQHVQVSIKGRPDELVTKQAVYFVKETS